MKIALDSEVGHISTSTNALHKQTNKHDLLVDLLKGIGIISVVIGHSSKLFSTFVYLYHLMIFFFASGMTYRPDKYADAYFYIGKQLKSTVKLFVPYSIAFLLLHNIFSHFQLLNIEPYTFPELIISFCNILVLNHNEQLLGALWFVPMFLLAKALFAIAFQWANNARHKCLAHVFVIIAFAYIGIYTNHKGMMLHYHIQTAFLGVPILYLGYFFQIYRSKVKKLYCIHPVILLGTGLFLAWFTKQGLGFVELSVNQIISPVLFYPITILGILFCINLADILQRFQYSLIAVSYIGSVSFHIMALHFSVFKCFDWIIGSLHGMDQQSLMLFPTSFNNNGLIYTILGVTIPTILVYLYRKIFKNRISNN